MQNNKHMLSLCASWTFLVFENTVAKIPWHVTAHKIDL